ncbi:S8 family serine peptidase [Aquisalimonas asiatica]|uniref:Subtilase family protein n=1 Tax=Aquisalimonas asiatica TaxID=406100 RepID=A0A1H8VVJ1_9GAMM|nr:S8 family serine peptidase [Aquisalimonas asiatica]SEP19462.1 Subtilase family protein [Aquisalimonas asiatica]
MGGNDSLGLFRASLSVMVAGIAVAVLLAGCASSSSGGNGGSSAPDDDPVWDDEPSNGDGDDEDEEEDEPEPVETNDQDYVIDDGGIANPWLNAEGDPSWSEPTEDDVEVHQAAQTMGLLDEDGNRASYLPDGDGEPLTGDGVTIAVYDNFIMEDHVQLSERDGDSNLTRYHNDTRDAPDNHGTHVAALAAGRNGVASSADLELFEGYNDSGDTSALQPPGDTDLYDDVVNDTDASIVNLSVSSVNTDADDLAAVLDEGIALVMAAGNDEDSVPNSTSLETANRLANDDEAGGLGVLVGAMDETNEALSELAQSNASGDVDAGGAEHYIAAPGEAIPSASTWNESDTSLTEMSGTSMAAPLVTGSLALMKERWSHKDMDELVAILFESANRDFDAFQDSIDDADEDAELESDRYDHTLSPVFGHGALDLEAAFAPEGELSVASADSESSATLASTTLTTGPALGDSLSSNEALSHAVAIDERNRDYAVDLSAMAIDADALPGRGFDFGAALGALATPRTHSEIDNPAFGTRMTLMTRGSVDTLGLAEGDRPTTESMSLVMDFEDGLRLDIHQAQLDFGTPWQSPVLANDSDLLMGVDSDAHIQGWDQASVMGAAFPVAENARLRVAVTRAANDVRTDALRPSPEDSSTAEEVSMALVGTYGENTLWHAETSVITQDAHILGSDGNGALRFGDNATTHTASLGVRHDQGAVSVFAWHEYGITHVDAAEQSVLAGVDRLHSQQTALGVELDLFDQGRTGAVVSRPLRVTRGSADLSVPNGINDDGDVTYLEASADMSPSGQETRVEAYYARGFAWGDAEGEFRLNATVRNQPNNIASADQMLGAGAVTSVRF